MSHTVYGRNEKITKGKIGVLKELIKHINSNDKEKYLNETMLDCHLVRWNEIVLFLIKNGVNINYVDKNGLGMPECAKRAKEEFCNDHWLISWGNMGMQICSKGKHCINIGNQTHIESNNFDMLSIRVFSFLGMKIFIFVILVWRNQKVRG